MNSSKIRENHCRYSELEIIDDDAPTIQTVIIIGSVLNELAFIIILTILYIYIDY